MHEENNIGAQYKLGKGVPVDYINALEWFHKSAQEGYAGAQYNLGRCVSVVLRVVKDSGQALEWYRKAAAQDRVDV